MLLHIGNGKGQKDRMVPLSPRLLAALREYWKQDRPPTYLFPGRTPEVPLSATTIQKMCKQAAATAGLSKHVSPHTLRHSYATGLRRSASNFQIQVTRRNPVIWGVKLNRFAACRWIAVAL